MPRPTPPQLIAIAFAVPAGLLAFGTQVPGGILAPLTGPWSAAIWGHNCGFYSISPTASIILAITGLPTIFLLTRPHLNRLIRLVPFTLWYLAWLATAAIGILNMSM